MYLHGVSLAGFFGLGTALIFGNKGKDREIRNESCFYLKLQSSLSLSSSAFSWHGDSAKKLLMI